MDELTREQTRSPASISLRWGAIRAHAFDPHDAIATFEQKAVRETGWTRGKAMRAIDEYRRFLYLAAESGHRVSPSPIVDAVWHAHLLYTGNYWSCCRDVLKIDLHHEPATGSKADRDSLDDAYAKTLSSYAAHFGTAAPADIWPEHPRQATLVRVDPARSVVLAKPVVWALVSSLILSAVFIVVLLAVVMLRTEVGR